MPGRPILGPRLSPSSQCNDCKHRVVGTATCSAFPKGIPEEIASGRFDHRKPYAGDHGIRYEPIDIP